MKHYEEEDDLFPQETDDNQPLEEQAEESEPSVPMGLSLRYGLGTFLTVGVVDLIAHFGPTGLVVGGIAAYAA